MKRLLTSLLLIGLTASLALALSTAYFQDIETSEANTFVAGQIDLLIGNASYYNGAPNSTTTWDPMSLDGNRLFFDFTDIKPGDWGQDTIELQVSDNDSWACYRLDLTSADDVNCTEPESRDDLTCDDPDSDSFDGDLQDQVNFILWVDDGDTVLENDEFANLLAQGKATDVFSGLEGALADSATANLFTGSNEPLNGGTSYYLGKAWCFGNFTFSPVAQDGSSPTNDPLVNPGFSCDGSGLNNASQTDKLMGDITFSAVQFRNNADFRCLPHTSPTPSPSPTPTPTPLLWIIGDEEANQTASPVDELNFTAFGVFPTPPAIGAPYVRAITQPVDDIKDKEFPWNTNYISNYARDISVNFSHSGATLPVRLTFSWSPGRSAFERKQVFLDGIQLGADVTATGVSTSGWWENMPRFTVVRDFDLTSGDHTLRFLHLTGDGTLWDFIKLERI